MSWNLHLVSRFSRLRNHQPPCSLLGKFRDTSSALRCNRVFSKTVRRRDGQTINAQTKRKIKYLTIFNSVANLQILYYITSVKIAVEVTRDSKRYFKKIKNKRKKKNEKENEKGKERRTCMEMETIALRFPSSSINVFLPFPALIRNV